MLWMRANEYGRLLVILVKVTGGFVGHAAIGHTLDFVVHQVNQQGAGEVHCSAHHSPGSALTPPSRMRVTFSSA
jgi:hypothetical protein